MMRRMQRQRPERARIRLMLELERHGTPKMSPMTDYRVSDRHNHKRLRRMQDPKKNAAKPIHNIQRKADLGKKSLQSIPTIPEI
jgi:hypothetical protein